MVKRSRSFDVSPLQIPEKYKRRKSGVPIRVKSEDDIIGFRKEKGGKCRRILTIYRDGESRSPLSWNLFPKVSGRSSIVNVTANTGIVNLALARFFNFKLNVEIDKSSSSVLLGHMEEGVIDYGIIRPRITSGILYQYPFSITSFTNVTDMEKRFKGICYSESVLEMFIRHIKLGIPHMFFLLPKRYIFNTNYINRIKSRGYSCMQIKVNSHTVFGIPTNETCYFTLLYKTIGSLKRKNYCENDLILKAKHTKRLRHDLQFMKSNGFIVNNGKLVDCDRFIDNDYTCNDRHRITMISKDYDPLFVYCIFKYIVNLGKTTPITPFTIRRFIDVSFKQHNMLPSYTSYWKIKRKKKITSMKPVKYDIDLGLLPSGYPICKSVARIPQKKHNKIVGFSYSGKNYEKEEVQREMASFFRVEKKTPEEHRKRFILNPDFIEYIRHYPRYWTSYKYYYDIFTET